MSVPPVFRQMLESDVDEVLDLEKRSFPDGWSRTSLRNEVLANHLSFPYVVVLDHTIVGYAIVWCMTGEAELTNFAIDSRFRRQGIGKSLLSYVVEDVTRKGIEVIHLEVRRSNKAARSLYSNFGFKDVGVRKNYYLKEMEDAILMTINLQEVPPNGLV